MKRYFVLFSGLIFLFLSFSCQNRRTDSALDEQIMSASNPYRVTLCVTEDLQTSMGINFELPEDVEGYVDYRKVGQTEFQRQITEKKTTQVGSQQIFHRAVTLTGLEPGTDYEYRVMGTEASEIFGFSTVDSQPDSISFALFSDPQGKDSVDYMTYSNNVILALETFGKRLDFAMLTGDMVNEDSDRLQWNLFFRYSSVFCLDTPIAAAIGNHETDSLTDPQIQSIEFSGYFHFPQNGPYYQPFDELEGDDRLPNFDLGKTYSFDLGGVHFVSIDSEIFNGIGGIDGTLDEENMDVFSEWLHQDLWPHREGWIIVFLHRGPYSLHYDSVNVRERLVPILETNRVDLVFSGHDHRYSRAIYQDSAPILFTNSDFYPCGETHLYPNISSFVRNLNDYSSEDGITYVVGNSAGIKFYGDERDSGVEVAYRYDEKNPVIPIVTVTESAITVTAYVIEKSDDLAFYQDCVSILETFVIRP